MKGPGSGDRSSRAFCEVGFWGGVISLGGGGTGNPDPGTIYV